MIWNWTRHRTQWRRDEALGEVLALAGDGVLASALLVTHDTSYEVITGDFRVEIRPNIGQVHYWISDRLIAVGLIGDAMPTGVPSLRALRLGAATPGEMVA